MLKANERTYPNSCWNKAKDDEIVFVLIDRDPEMADTIRDWARRRVEHGHNKATDDKIRHALVLADVIEVKQKGLG